MYSNKTLNQLEITVAAAIPKKPNSRNKKILKNVFKITVIIEKFNGSLEFSFAKKTFML